jgi:hypothetical protein
MKTIVLFSLVVLSSCAALGTCGGGGGPGGDAPRPSPGGPRAGERVELDHALVSDAVSTLAQSAGTPVVIAPDAEDLARCARITVVAPPGTSPAALLSLVDEAVRPSGLLLERSAAGVVLRRDPGVHPPPGCGLAVRERVSPLELLPMRDAGPGPEPSVSREDAALRVANGVKQVSENEYLVARDVSDVLFDTRQGIAGSVRIIPHFEGPDVVGLKLYGIRRDSPMGILGFKNGDMVREVGGYQVANPDAALEAYTKLRGTSPIDVAIVRQGEPLILRYRVVDSLPSEPTKTPPRPR